MQHRYGTCCRPAVVRARLAPLLSFLGSQVDHVNGFESQIEGLKCVGCEKIFQEQVSSVTQWAELDRALEIHSRGDVLHEIGPPGRAQLCRSVRHREAHRGQGRLATRQQYEDGHVAAQRHKDTVIALHAIEHTGAYDGVEDRRSSATGIRTG